MLFATEQSGAEARVDRPVLTAAAFPRVPDTSEQVAAENMRRLAYADTSYRHVMAGAGHVA